MRRRSNEAALAPAKAASGFEGSAQEVLDTSEDAMHVERVRRLRLRPFLPFLVAMLPRSTDAWCPCCTKIEGGHRVRCALYGDAGWPR